MAQYKFTAALNAADIPPLSRLQGRSVIIGQMDNKLRDPATNNTSNLDNNPQNLPQVLYGENIIPTEGGVQSVGYADVGGTFPAAGVAEECITLRQDNASALWCPAGGYNYMKTAVANAWASGGAVAGAPITNTVSVAYVNGETYVCYANTFIGQYDSGTNTITNVGGAVTYIAVANIVAICGSGNYMIAITSDGAIHWSSLTNPLEFTPSVTTGAGEQTPLDIRGSPTYLTPTSGGFLIHCEENTVAAVYTQNSVAPWIFREVKGSGGISDASAIDKGNYKISKESTSGVVYFFGLHGMQAMNIREAENIHPAITDFLAGRTYETFDTATNTIALVRDATLRAKVAFLFNRYLMISYGLQASETLSYVLVYDTILKRWGKLKIDHVDIFTFQETSSTARDSIFTVASNGQMKRVILDLRTTVDTGVLLLGKYQLNRASKICSEELELELLDSTEAVTAHVISSNDGANFDRVDAMVVAAATNKYRKFQKQVESENLLYLVKGTFSLATALLTVTRGARS